ncbi:MAG: rhodanese-like domain-containing protein [Acidobacteriota bacterium]|nr:rhodanese-like domain-containing protein [Acidobacteriota bacterium]
MFVKRFFEPAIAQASYLIGCHATGESIVIDANRDVDQYLAAAAQEGLRITHVTETHIHADYVSGSRELAACTGGALYLSDEGDRDWKYQFASEGRLLHDGDRMTVGNIRVDVLHTPGHTPEHLTFLITDGAAADQPIAAVTGDFIFVGDVGRPDLLERAAGIAGTMEAGARTLWQSLQKFAAHEDWLQIWPGHGAGSACGKGISAIPSSTLGYERRFNWAFGIKSEAAFVESVLAGQPEPPKYFAHMKRINKAGPALLGGFHVPPRQPDGGLVSRLATKALVIDTRPAVDYASGHLPGTLNIPFNSSFVTWAGWLVPAAAEVYLIVDDATVVRLEETVRALALIGIDSVTGYFPASALNEAKAAGSAFTTVPEITAAALSRRLESCEVSVIDVRSANEWAAGHLPGAIHVPLGYLADRLQSLPAGKPIVVQCQLGGRSAIAASLLERLGVKDVINLTGGYAAWSAAGLPVEGAPSKGARHEGGAREPQTARS